MVCSTSLVYRFQAGWCWLSQSQSPPEGGTPNLFAFAPCYLSLPSILQAHEFGP